MSSRRRLSKKARQSRLDREWERSTEFKAQTGRILSPGVEFSVRGERGRFRFVEYVDNGYASWISAVGGTKGVAMMRAFAPDRVKRVHRTKTVISGQEALALMRAKRAAKGGA